MRNKGIWVAIILILAAGIIFTRYTRHYVAGRSETAQELSAGEGGADPALAMAAEAETSTEQTFAASKTVPNAALRVTAAETDTSSAEESQPSEETTDEDTQEESDSDTGTDRRARDAAFDTTDEESSEEDIQETSTEADTALQQEQNSNSKVSGGAAGNAVLRRTKKQQETSNTFLTAEDYRTRFRNLDKEIKEHAKETGVSSNYAIKVRMESERKLWENEVDLVVQDLSGRLEDKERDDLAEAQRLWYQDREARAVEESEKKKGSALAELEYASQLVSGTRDRAYALVKEYETDLNSD